RAADRRQRGGGGPAAAALPQEHVQLRPADRRPAAAAARLARPQGNPMNRTTVGLVTLLALLLAAPTLLGGYGLSVLILILYFAYVGQAWNIMMGFAGQLSLGHALYAGLGGYMAAGLYFHYGIGPWAGVFVAVAAAVAAAAVVGYLG